MWFLLSASLSLLLSSSHLSSPLSSLLFRIWILLLVSKVVPEVVFRLFGLSFPFLSPSCLSLFLPGYPCSQSGYRKEEVWESECRGVLSTVARWLMFFVLFFLEGVFSCLCAENRGLD